MDFTPASTGPVPSPSTLPPAPISTLLREPDSRWAARNIPEIMAVDAQVQPLATPLPDYCALETHLFLGDALDYIAGHSVAVIPFRSLQIHMAANIQDIPAMEDQVRASEEALNQETLP